MSSSIETGDQAENWAIEPAPASSFLQRRWLTLAVMVVVFCSGAAIGSGLTTISIENERAKRLKNPWWGQKHMLAALTRELDLSDDQSAEVAGILQNHDLAVKKIWREEVNPKMWTLVKQLDSKIASVLTPDQEPLWHAWLDKRKSRVCSPPSRTAGHNSTGHNSPGHDRDGRSHGQHGRDGGRPAPAKPDGV